MSYNPEYFSCLWLDKNVHVTEDNKATLKELRQAINYLKIFDDSSRCEQYIRETKNEKVILIVSGLLGRDIIPRIHDLSQLSAFYVYCQNKVGNEQWANKYIKVNGVFTERDKLVQQVARDQTARNRAQYGAVISVVYSRSQTSEARHASFMWFQLFIEALLRVPFKSKDHKIFLDLFKNSYSENEKEMKIINDFENRYTPEKAIWWYTRESCFYRILNKALRVQDFDMLFALRFFTTDIAKRLQIEYEKFIRTSNNRDIIHVYRGQMIGTQELDLIKKSIGEYLPMNSFFSTSCQQSIALRHARVHKPTDTLKPIVFEISIDPRLKTKPFAYLNDLSFYPKEEELLIMIGALFKIHDISEDKEKGVWWAKISLADEDNFPLKRTYESMKNEMGEETNLNSLGKILHKMGEYERAKTCYRDMIEEVQLIQATATLGLGAVLTSCNEGDESCKKLEAALLSRKTLLGDDHADIAESYAFLGIACLTTGKDYEKSLHNLKKAMKIQEATLPTNSRSLAFTYHHIANTYRMMKRYSKSAQYYSKALEIRKNTLPKNHPDIASTYNDLGSLHFSKKDYSKALTYFEKSLSIACKVLPPDHKDIESTKESISKVKLKESLSLTDENTF